MFTKFKCWFIVEIKRIRRVGLEAAIPKMNAKDLKPGGYYFLIVIFPLIYYKESLKKVLVLN